MKGSRLYLIVFLLTSLSCFALEVEPSNLKTDTIQNDSLSNKEVRKLSRLEEKKAFKSTNNRFGIKTSFVYAYLDTKVSFELPRGNLSSTLSLESNFDLPASSSFFTGAFVFRINPRNGIYAQYYGINRSKSSQSTEDYFFKNDTIFSGTDIKAHFNTQVISAGYLHSILKDPNAFLGFYFNIYFMILETGVKSEKESISSNVEFIAPLPNFGVLASFKLARWLYLDGDIGFFSLHASTFSGSLYNFNMSLLAKPVNWLGINVGYQVFDVRVWFPSEGINTTVDYNFRGPSIGVSFFF